MEVINKRNNKKICECKVAKSILERCKGLLGRKNINENEGLLILNCKSIHSFFMQFDICAIFLDKNNKIIAILDNFKRNRMSSYYINSKNVLEMKAFKATELDIKKGDILEFKEI